MTERDDLGQVLGDWLAEGPVRTPEPALAVAVQHARSHPRRPDPFAFVRRDPMAGRTRFLGLAPVPVLAVLALLVLAVVGVSLVGGQRDEAPPPVPSLPTSSPTGSPAPSSSFPRRVPLQTGTAATITVAVVDDSGLLVDARTAPPADGGSQPAGTVGVTSVDDRTILLTWTDAACDADYGLVVETTTTMTLTTPACVGDTMSIDRRLFLQFAVPVDSAAVRVTVIPAP